MIKYKNQIIIEKGRFILNCFRIPKFISLILGLLMLVSLCLPFIILAIVNGEGGHLSAWFFVSLAILWRISYYFFKILSWNHNGIEVYEISENMIYLTAGSTYMKFRKDEISTKNLTLSIEKLEKKKFQNDIEEWICFIKFENGEKEIQSNLKIPLTQIEYLKEKLFTDFQINV